MPWGTADAQTVAVSLVEAMENPRGNRSQMNTEEEGMEAGSSAGRVLEVVCCVSG